ncbi:MAG: DNA internalization-related competence protein ComEC/Rec2 [Phycisphaerales bacterium]|nr:DNA internalization-related competence protein ComEC/Rec2 [Phycisphaerales bacterium]
MTCVDRNRVVQITNPASHRITKLWAGLTCIAGIVAGVSLGVAAPNARNTLMPPHRHEHFLVAVEGVVSSRPIVTSSTTRMFDDDEQVTRLLLKSVQMLDGYPPKLNQVKQPQITCMVWIQGNLKHIERGSLVRLMGWARLPTQPKSPGGFDQVDWANQHGISLLISVPNISLVKVLQSEHTMNVLTALGQYRDALHDCVGEAATNGLSPAAGGTIKALLLGQRSGSELTRLMDLLRRLGVAHLLAISGLHLAIAVGLVITIARLLHVSFRMIGILVITMALLTLFVVEVRPPLLRAAIMTIFFGGSLILGRGLALTGTLSIAALALLSVRPQELGAPGFQLSFGVVIGLVVLTPRVTKRWLGTELNSIQPQLESKARRWIANFIAGSLVAWLIATPLVAYHFQIFSPLAAPLGIVLLPLITILMIVGALHISIGVVLSVSLEPLCWLINTLVTGIDCTLAVVSSWRASWWPLPQIPVALCVFGLIWSIAWSVVESTRWRKPIVMGGVLLFVSLIVSSLLLCRSGPLRIDMLAVGDGSSYLLRSGTHIALFDAGSQKGPSIGRGTITPALHALGVRRLDILFLSHPHRDHISGAIEVLQEFRPKRLVISGQFISSIDTEPQNASDRWAQRVLEVAEEVGVLVEVATMGDSWSFGDTKCICLAPQNSMIYASENDASLVLQLDVLGRRILLCGDIQEQGIKLLLTTPNIGPVDVIEAPHHGEESGASKQLINQLQPLIVLQSSKRSRDGQWLKKSERIHLHTAEDGTCSIYVARDGGIEVKRWDGLLEQEPHRDR